jgi:uncharacterized protein YrzB (UPF0473 family)
MDKTLIEKIQDPDYIEPLILFNKKGEEIAFEQICYVPFENSHYVILKPVKYLQGLGENEALVFRISDEQLLLVVDDEIIDSVFEIYNMLIKESEGNS